MAAKGETPDLDSFEWLEWPTPNDSQIISKARIEDGFIDEAVTFVKEKKKCLKYGRKGNPHKREFVVIGEGKDDLKLQWFGSKASKTPDQTQVYLKDVHKLVAGQATPKFGRLARKSSLSRYVSLRSFSLLYGPKDEPQSIDVACDTEEEWTTWIVGLFELLYTYIYPPPPESKEKAKDEAPKKGNRLAAMAAMFEKKIEEVNVAQVSSFADSDEAKSMKQYSKVSAVLKMAEEFEAESKKEYGRFLKLTKPEQDVARGKRIKLISEEIVNSEKLYHNFMYTIVEHWQKPFRECVAQNKALKQRHLEKLFVNVDSIAPVHKLISDALQKVGVSNVKPQPSRVWRESNKKKLDDVPESPNMNDDPKTIAEVFLKFAHYLLIYAPYVNAYEQIVETFQELSSVSQFKTYLEEAQQNEAITQDIMSYLIMPVQRLPRYRMLLAELLKYTPDGTPSHKELEISLEKIKEINTTINERKRHAENRTKIVALNKMIGKDYPDLVTPSRSLIHDGILKLQKNNKPVHIYIFNDLFLYTSDSGKFKGAQDWANVELLEGKMDGEHTASIISTSFGETPINMTVILAPETRDAWVIPIRKQIDTQKDLSVERGRGRGRGRTRTRSGSGGPQELGALAPPDTNRSLSVSPQSRGSASLESPKFRDRRSKSTSLKTRLTRVKSNII